MCVCIFFPWPWTQLIRMQNENKMNKTAWNYGHNTCASLLLQLTKTSQINEQINDEKNATSYGWTTHSTPTPLHFDGKLNFNAKTMRKNNHSTALKGHSLHYHFELNCMSGKQQRCFVQVVCCFLAIIFSFRVLPFCQPLHHTTIDKLCATAYQRHCMFAILNGISRLCCVYASSLRVCLSLSLLPFWQYHK